MALPCRGLQWLPWRLSGYEAEAACRTALKTERQDKDAGPGQEPAGEMGFCGKSFLHCSPDLRELRGGGDGPVFVACGGAPGSAICKAPSLNKKTQLPLLGPWRSHPQIKDK